MDKTNKELRTWLLKWATDRSCNWLTKEEIEDFCLIAQRLEASEITEAQLEAACNAYNDHDGGFGDAMRAALLAAREA